MRKGSKVGIGNLNEDLVSENKDISNIAEKCFIASSKKNQTTEEKDEIFRHRRINLILNEFRLYL